MKPEDREILLEKMSQFMDQRVEAQDKLANYLKEFSEHLFTAIERTMVELHARGIPGIGKSRRIVHPAGGGREGLQIFIEDWSIIFVPLQGYARPNAADEARILPVQFKESCARIGAFLGDDPQGKAFYDFILFQDGSWFAWGYGWPKQQSDIESTDFDGLSLELIYSFIRDIFVTWQARGDTQLATAMDVKKRAYTFGLPGEDRQGS